jgi:hypothetical protein
MFIGKTKTLALILLLIANAGTIGCGASLANGLLAAADPAKIETPEEERIGPPLDLEPGRSSADASAVPDLRESPAPLASSAGYQPIRCGSTSGRPPSFPR